MQRLGKNAGGYHGERIDVESTRAALVAAARARGWTVDELAAGSHRLPVLRRAARGAAARHFYLSSGIHGDEPAGPCALLRLLEEDHWPDAHLSLAPLLNPGGLARNTRENPEGVDINRDYRHLRSTEAAAHVRWLETLPPIDLSVLLHEDWESHGFYCYEFDLERRRGGHLAREIVDAVSRACPIDGSPVIDGRPSSEPGILRPTEWPGFTLKDRPEWPETVWLALHRTRLNYTLEAPSDWPLAVRVEALVTGVRTALARHSDEPSAA